MKASDLLVKCLEEEGIEYIFGVPGEENADFMMSLEQSTEDPVHSDAARTRRGVYGRNLRPADRQPGRLRLGTLGPGATNLITGVADSNMDRAPMLVLTGQGSTDRSAQGIAPDHGCRQHVQACDKVGNDNSEGRYHPGNCPQGSAPSTHREAGRRAYRTCRRTSPSTDSSEIANEAHGAFAARCPTSKIVDQGLRDATGKPEAPGHYRRQRLYPAACKQAACAFFARRPASVLSAHSWRKGCVDMDAGLLPVHGRTRQQGPHVDGDRRCRPRHHARLRHGRVPPATLESERRQEASCMPISCPPKSMSTIIRRPS